MTTKEEKTGAAVAMETIAAPGRWLKKGFAAVQQSVAVGNKEEDEEAREGTNDKPLAKGNGDADKKSSASIVHRGLDTPAEKEDDEPPSDEGGAPEEKDDADKKSSASIERSLDAPAEKELDEPPSDEGGAPAEKDDEEPPSEDDGGDAPAEKENDEPPSDDGGSRSYSPPAEVVAAVSEKNPEPAEKEDGEPPSDDGGSGSGSDSSENWEFSGDEAWPASGARYAPVGDAESRVSAGGSSRLAREFTMGTGFHHLNEGGNRAMSSSPANTILPPPGVGGAGLSHYNEAAIDLMDKHGLKEKGLRVSKRTYLDKVLLVTDSPHAIRVYSGDDDGPCIVGMALIRDDIVFTSGVLSEETPPLTLELEPDRPVIESIELQCCTWLEGKDRVEKKISYLRMSSGSNVLVFGQFHMPGFDGEHRIYAEPESAAGNLCISGIGYFDNKPISLQVVDLGSDCPDVVDAMDSCVYYNNGVISGNVVRSRAPEVEFLGSITTENDDVWDVLLGCMDAVENSSPSHGELLPNAVNMLEGALAGDVNAIHSVLRLDRFLTHTIQEKKTIRTFENDHLNFYAKLIPMKQMWGIFSNAVERIKRIHSCQPELNSFSVAFLQGKKDDWTKAVFIFLTQLTLLILTITHIWINRADAYHVPGPLRLIVSICGTIVVDFMAKQSKDNFDDFAAIFPEYDGTALYKLDAFSNIVGGYLVTISTFFLLFMTDDNLDIVLNATALLFVLELDEMMVDTNPIWVTGVYRAYFMKDIIKNLNESDKRYWDPEYLRKDRGEHYRIHLPSCSFLFPGK